MLDQTGHTMCFTRAGACVVSVVGAGLLDLHMVVAGVGAVSRAGARLQLDLLDLHRVRIGAGVMNRARAGL